MKDKILFNKKLLEIIACPKDLSDLEYKIDTNQLVCKKCHTKYEIENSIPIMLQKGSSCNE